MEHFEPTLAEWKALYHAALEFKEAGCWDWMLDSDIFGVRVLETEEIGYCCIMGNGGEFYGLAVYEGTEGLEGLLKIQKGIVPSGVDALHAQKCLMASFEDREYLEQHDLKLIKKLGFKFRGRHSWPMFRSYLPGYVPWDVDSQQARFLTFALEQALVVSLETKNNKNRLKSKKKDHYLVRVQTLEVKGMQWTDEWLRPATMDKQTFTNEPLDEVSIQRIKKNSTGKHGTVELDYFYSPSPVREGSERPYFPYVFLWADSESGFIFKVHVAIPSAYRRELCSEMLNFLQSNKIIPAELLVKKQEAYQLLEPIASRLGIRIKIVNELEAVEEAKLHMLDFLQKDASQFGI